MSEELIDSYINRAAIEKETQFLVGKLEEVHTVFNKIKALKIQLQGANSFVQIADAIGKVKKEETEFIKLQAQVEQSYQKRKVALDEVQKSELALIKTYEKRQSNTSDISKDLAEERILLAEQSKALKDNAREALGLVSAYEKLQKEFNIASKEAKDNGAIFGTNSKKYQEAAARASELNDKLKAIDGGIGNFQRNVGNYAGSLSGSFNTIKEELVTLQSKLKQTGLSAGEIDKLNKQSILLENVLKGLDKEFTTTKGEMRGFTEAAKQIGLEFGVASKEFQSFIQDVASKKDELKDIEAAINFAASDTSHLDGVLTAVNGVAGAFSAAEGASALFGDAGKDVQEIMVKLQAAIAITTGLQQVINAVQTDGAAVQEYLRIKTLLLSTAEGITAKTKLLLAGSSQAAAVATGEQALATEALVVTQGENIISAEGAVLANAEVAVTGEVAAGALVTQTGATVATTAATYSLVEAIVATGIGAIVVALAVGLGFLVKAIYDEANSAQTALEKNKALAETMKEINGIIDAQNKLYAESSAFRRKGLEQELAAASASGKSQQEIFNIKKKLADFDAKENENAKRRYKEQTGLDPTQDNLTKNAAKLNDALNQLKDLEKIKEEGQKRQKDGKFEGADKAIEDQKIIVEAAQKAFDDNKKIVEDDLNIKNNANNLNLENAKFTSDELRKLSLETTKINASLVIDANSRILSSEKSTQQQRIAALKSTAEQQKAIAQADNRAIQNDPTQSVQAKEIATRNLKATITKIERDGNEQIAKVNEDYRKRDLASTLSYDKIVSDNIIKENEKIASDENFSLDIRLEAFNKFQKAKADQIELEYQTQKELNKTNGSTKGERELLEKDHEAKITALIAEGSAKQIEIQLNALDTITNKLKEEYSNREKLIESNYIDESSKTSIKYSNDVIALNDSLQKGEISLANYNIKRKKLDDTYNKQSLLDTQKKLTDELNAVKDAYEKGAKDLENNKKALEKLNAKPVLTVDEVDEKAKLEQKIKNYENYGSKIKKIDQELNDNKAKLSDEDIAKKKEADATMKANYEAAAAEILDIFKELIAASYQRELDAIQEQSIAIDAKKQKDIDVANQTIVNEQDKAARIKIIEAKAQADKDLLEQKKRKVQLEQARFEKAYNIGKIIADTAAAVVKTLAVAGPFSMPLAVSIGVLGAAQLAKVIATPLPKYRDGVERHPGGLAIVGDGGQQELVIEPTGKTYTTPSTPTIMDLPIGTKVLPSVEDITRYLTLAATPRLKNIDGESMNNYELISEMRKLNSRIGSVEKAIKNKKETHFNVTRWGMLAMQQEDQNQIDYLNENLRF